MEPQATQTQNMSIGERRHCCVTFEIYISRICKRKKTYRFCNVRKWSLPYLKSVLRLSCVVHGPIYGRFMGFYVNGFLSIYNPR